MHLLLLAALFAAPLPTADELLAKNLEARGGAAALQAIRSLRLTGKLKRWSGESDWSEVRARPLRIRTELTRQGLTEIEAFDGQVAWSVDPSEGRIDAQRESPDEARELAAEADLEGPLVHAREKGHRVELLGADDVDGTPAWKLRVTLAGGDVRYVFLDPDSFLEVRVISERKVRGVERTRETDLGSWVRAAGAWFPLSIEQGQPGRPKGIRLSVEKIEVNPPVDDALFRMPAEGERAGRAAAADPRLPDATEAAIPKAAPRGPPSPDAGVLSGLGARNLGSAVMSGRVAALDARNLEGKTLVYLGAASGGVWKSPDGGTTWKPVFDQQPVQSIGAIAIDPSNPKTVWVGTGESWTRNSVSAGDGVYRSTDGGETWTNLGLRDTERIARILVHPKDPDTVWVCAPGKLWSDGAERGLFKTTDGGKSWALVLKGPNLSTGCSGLSMDPKNPEVLFAGLWDFRRKGWTFRSGGEGPEAPSGSALFRTADGGKTWAEVAAGLGPKPWGRVEVAVAPSDGRVVYAFVESKDSALFRSADGGRTWEKRDKSSGMVWRPFYFARLVVDPTDPDRLFKPGGGLSASDDGGRSFSSSGGGAHGDWHDLWIDPQNPKHVLGGDDGGFWTSWDGGNRWIKSNNLPISQFYHVSVDDRDPYQVYGGLQDNSSWVAPSAKPGGVDASAWQNLYSGDGFWVIPDPTDPDAAYAESQGGYVARVDRRTGVQRDIQPTARYGEKLRFNWNTPIHASPTQKGTIYVGAQFLFRSRDRGDTWERISPDLTTNDPEKQRQEQSGGVTVDNSSAEMHTTLYSISESPLDPRTIWVGTDDGNLQLTRDGGASWSNVAGAVRGLPKASWVSWVEASRFAPGTAYAAFDRHTAGDFAPWIFRTTDFGRSWVRIASPEQGVRGWAHVIKEDPVERSLLFAGTEYGLWISLDAGKGWAAFKGGGFPSVAVREVQIHPREHDLVIATHGRGIWIVDDLTPLRALTPAALAADAAFLPGRPAQQRLPAWGGWVQGDASFVGPNPPDGAVITWVQRSRHVYGPMRLEILDPQGKLIETLTPSKRRGINRAVWSMRLPPPRVPRAAQLAGGSTLGPRVLPGAYRARLVKGSEAIETTLEVRSDARAPHPPAERRQGFEAALRVHALFGRMSALVDRLEAARDAARARSKALPAGDALAARLAAATGKLEAARGRIVATAEGGAVTGEERIREHADQLYAALASWEGKPGAYQLERIDALERELDDVRAELDALTAAELRPIDAELAARRLAPIAPAP